MTISKKQKTREKITITIRREIWQTLSQIKLDKSMRGFNEVLEYLLKSKVAKEVKT